MFERNEGMKRCKAGRFPRKPLLFTPMGTKHPAVRHRSMDGRVHRNPSILITRNRKGGTGRQDDGATCGGQDWG
jgi:hypothetical protein